MAKLHGPSKQIADLSSKLMAEGAGLPDMRLILLVFIQELDGMHTSLSDMAEDIESIGHKMDGNGNPGVWSRVADVEKEFAKVKLEHEHRCPAERIDGIEKRVAGIENSLSTLRTEAGLDVAGWRALSKHRMAYLAAFVALAGLLLSGLIFWRDMRRESIDDMFKKVLNARSEPQPPPAQK